MKKRRWLSFVTAILTVTTLLLSGCTDTLDESISSEVFVGSSQVFEEEPEEVSFKADTSWFTGSEAEYTINTAEELLGFQELREEGESFEDVIIRLGQDIRLNEGTAKDIKKRGEDNILWVALDPKNEFKGVFDGKGFTVSGLYMAGEGSANFGMFGTLGGKAVIKNFTLNDSYFVGPADTKKVLGAIAGSVAENGKVTIKNVVSNATIEEDGKLSYVGGILGQINTPSKVTIEKCSFGGSIDISGNGAAGIIGYVSHSKCKLTINNCVNNGTVTAGTNAGDIIGWLNKGTIELNDCLGATASNDILIGGMNSDNVSKKTLKVTIDGASATGDASGAKYNSNTAWFTKDRDTYTISTLEQLLGFMDLRMDGESFDNVTILLGADIVVNPGNSIEVRDRGSKNIAWALIPSDNQFKGVFDGQNHSISGVYLQMKSSGSKGMFGALGDGSEIKNLSIINSYFGGPKEEYKNSLGAIASQTFGNVLISNVHVDAVIAERLGTPLNWVGGFVGRVNAKSSLVFENCTMNGSIATSGDGVGGFVGYVSHSRAGVTFNSCVNKADLSGGSVGQLVGFMNKGTVTSLWSVGVDGGTDDLVGRTYDKNNILITVDKEIVKWEKKWPKKVYGTTGWFQNTGTAGNPEICVITTDKDLFGLNELQSKGEDFEHTIIQLGNDISINQDQYWKPIASSNVFKGTFDGQGYTISGLKFHLKGSGYKGMFGTLADGAVITNFTLANSEFVGTTATDSTKSYFGMIASTASGNVNISNVTIADTSVMREYVDQNGTTAKMNNLAGFIGAIRAEEDTNVTIENCTFNGVINSSSRFTTGFVGLVGTNAANVNVTLNLNNNAYNGSIVGSDRYAAGFIGRIYNETEGADNVITVNADNNIFNGSIVTKTLAEGAQANQSTHSGGFIGNVASKALVTIKDFTFANGEITSAGMNAGAVVGSITSESDITIDNFKFENGSISGSENVGGIIGQFSYSDAKLTVVDAKIGDTCTMTAAVADTDGTYIGDANKGDIIVKGCDVIDDGSGLYGTFNAEDATVAYYYNGNPVTGWYNDTDTTFTLYTADQLMGFATLLAEGNTFEGKTIKLAKDMVINEGTSADIKGASEKFTWNSHETQFKGTFDGQGHTILGVYLCADEKIRGMFGILGGTAELKDFTVDNAYIEGITNSIGTLAGAVEGSDVKITNVTCNALVEERGQMKYAGGFVGKVNAAAKLTMQACTFNGSVTITGEDAGGLIGMVSHSSAVVELKECANNGIITAADTAGGNKTAGAIIGHTNKGTIKLDNCTNSVTGLELVGYKERDNVTIVNFIPNTDWYSASETVFTLTTGEQLAGFNILHAAGNTFEGKTIRLGADVVINAGNSAAVQAAGANNAYVWKESDTEFKGIFDGYGNTISGIYMEASDNHRGMFGTLADGSEIKNFTLNSSCFESTATENKEGLGALAGQTKGTVTVTGIHCNDVVVDGGAKIKYLGGLIGNVVEASTLTLENITFHGNVTTDRAWAAGIIGYVGKDNSTPITVNLTNCNVLDGSTVSASGTNQGDIIGYVKNAAVNMKGCNGFNNNNNLIGTAHSSAVVTSIYSGTPDTNWDKNVSETTYTIYTADQLMGFADTQSSANQSGKTFKLDCNMVINEGTLDDLKTNGGYVWKKGKTFTSVFDGQGHSILGVYMESADSDVGMFGILGNGAAVKNLTIDKSYYKSTVSSAKQFWGIVAARTAGGSGVAMSISNVTIGEDVLMAAEPTSNIGNINNVGGIIGGNAKEARLTIDGCTFKGDINLEKCNSGVEQYIGGMVGLVKHARAIVLIQNSTVTSATNILNSELQSGALGAFIGFVDICTNVTVESTCTNNYSGAPIGKINPDSANKVNGEVTTQASLLSTQEAMLLQAPVTEAATEPTAAPAMESTPEPNVVPLEEAVAEPTTEPVVEPTMEPVVEPTIEPISEPTAEPVTEQVTVPAADAA